MPLHDNGTLTPERDDEEAYTTILTDVQDTIARFPETISLYREDLEKLLCTFIKSKDSEDRLRKRTHEIQNEINIHRDIIARDEEEQNEVIQQKLKLRSELDTILVQVAASNQVELDKQIKLSDVKNKRKGVKEELTHLNRYNMSKTSTSGDKAATALFAETRMVNSDLDFRITMLRKERLEHANDLESEQLGFEDLKLVTSNLKALLEDMEAKHEHFIETRDNKLEALQCIQNEAEKEARRKHNLEKKMRMLKVSFSSLTEDINLKEAKAKELGDQLLEKENLVRNSKIQIEKYNKQYDTLFRSTHTLTDAMQGQWKNNVEAQSDNEKMELDTKLQEEAIRTVLVDSDKVEKLIELAKEQLQETEVKRIECDRERDRIKAELNGILSVSFVAEQKEHAVLLQKVESVQRERNVIKKILVRADDRGHAALDLYKTKENTRKNLENEIQGMRKHVEQQRRHIQKLVAEREKFNSEVHQAIAKYKSAVDEAKIQDAQILCLQQRMTASETRLKQQKEMYETLQTDRNAYSKQLIEAQERIAELKQEFKVMKHQIEQLKEEIVAKDHALVQEHFDHHKVDKEKDTLQNELSRLKKQIVLSQEIIENQETEIVKLAGILKIAEQEKARQEKEYQTLVQERDTLRQQVVQRQSENELLDKKIRLQNLSLEKGAVQYEDRKKHLMTLQQQLGALRIQDNQMQMQLQDKCNLDQELIRIERVLNQERIKIRALSDELDHPLNVHRWRGLEESDPERFECIRRLQMLQRELVQKYDEIATQDLFILEKEKLYIELKMVMSRQPGAEVLDQLVAYKGTLKTKRNQMKQMEMELQFFKNQVNGYKDEQHNHRKEKKNILKNWIDQELAKANNRRIESLGKDEEEKSNA